MSNSLYKDLIKAELGRNGFVEVDPRHVEAYMRLQHSTLDGLSAVQFNYEVRLFAGVVMTELPDAELLAQSYGL